MSRVRNQAHNSGSKLIAHSHGGSSLSPPMTTRVIASHATAVRVIEPSGSRKTNTA